MTALLPAGSNRPVASGTVAVSLDMQGLGRRYALAALARMGRGSAWRLECRG